MTKNITNNSLTSLNYLMRNQLGNASGSIENNRLLKHENIQFQNDQVTLSYSSEPTATYNHSTSPAGTKGDGYDLLRGLVLNIFKEQGIDYTTQTGDAEIDIGTVSPDEAQELIAEDGYFGVEKTSQRIFDLAAGIAGGDPVRIDAIREGVENGFQEALDAFGGWLPDISYDTYDTVMKKLDGWAGIDSNQNSQNQVKS